jgi:hypothetical protein
MLVVCKQFAMPSAADISIATAIQIAALCLSVLAMGQAQDHPELCGKTEASIPLPTDTTMTSDPSTGRSELRSKASGHVVALPGVMEEVQQVCRVSQDTWVVFGPATPALYNIEIVRPSDGSLLDSFYAFNPDIPPTNTGLSGGNSIPRKHLLQRSI